jgi:hypothetical protein
MTEREWTVYTNEDGEPWAIFLHGHGHDLRTIRSIGCKKEMREAFIHHAGDDDGFFHGNLDIGRWWIRDAAETDDSMNPDFPWVFCDEGDPGAKPITGAKF